MKVLGILSGALLLTACASTPQDCDPSNRDASILNKAGCVYGGQYVQRIDNKTGVLLDEQKANELFRATYQALQQESQQVSTELADQQASMARMQTSIGALLTEIKSKSTGNQQVAGQISAVETRLQQLQQQIDNAQANGDTIPVLQQRQQMAELQLSVQDLQASLGLR